MKVVGLLFPFISAVVPVYCVSMPLSFSFSGYFMKSFPHISGSNSFPVLFWSHELSGLAVNSSEFLICYVCGAQGVLDGAGFPARVTAHFVAVEGQPRPRTTILIKFSEEVHLSIDQAYEY